MAPTYQLKTNRGWLKMILLSLITLGIYPLVIYTQMSDEINTIASKHDGKKTMNYCLLFFVVAPLTLGIGSLVWYHNISNRIGAELRRRNIPYDFGAGSFWGWNILGAFIFVGPFIYLHKLCTAMNMLCADYNVHG